MPEKQNNPNISQPLRALYYIYIILLSLFLHCKTIVKLFHSQYKISSSLSCSPGEKMSGLKRMSNDVLLMEPTALHALRTTSRLLGSVFDQDHIRGKDANVLKALATDTSFQRI